MALELEPSGAFGCLGEASIMQKSGMYNAFVSTSAMSYEKK